MAQAISVSDEDVAIFREWLVMQPFLPQDTDDVTIRTFIKCTKGSVQKAKIRYDNYIRSQQTLPEIFDDFDPLSEKRVKTNEHLAICSIPGDEYTVVITKLLSEDSTHVDVTAYFMKQFFNTQTLVWDDKLGNCQMVYILDFAGAGLGHFKGVNPVIAEKIVTAVTGASPVRFTGIHLVNLPSIVEWAINLFLQFVPEKLKQRLTVHSSQDTLKDHVDVRFLPKEYGGQSESVEEHYEKHLARLKEYREKFVAQKGKRDAEAKLRPKEVNPEMLGTFRKLAID